MEIEYELSPKGDAAVILHPKVGEVWCSRKCLEALINGRGDELAFYHVNSPEYGEEPFYAVSFKGRRNWRRGKIIMDTTIHEI